jgi:hypothetical protein
MTSEKLIIMQQQLTIYEQSEYEAQRISAILSDENQNLKSNADDTSLQRRQKISQLKDVIMNLETDRETMRIGLLDANLSIQEDLDYFQRGKIKDFRRVMKNFGEGFKNYHEKVGSVWKGVRDVIVSSEV